MADYDNTNSGALFDNNRKASDKHPDMTGKMNVNGVDHWFSGWWKKSQKGQQFLSLSLGKPVDEQRQEPRGRPASRPAPRGRQDEFDDDRY